MALTAGTRLGPYEIQSPVGGGGMGEVYRARDTRLDRTVAIKILRTHLSDSPEFQQRIVASGTGIRTKFMLAAMKTQEAHRPRVSPSGIIASIKDRICPPK